MRLPGEDAISQWAVGLACLIAVVFLVFHTPAEGVWKLFAAIQSVAVLPLKNLSGDPSQEYFSDSMTDELITQLAKISSLKVPSAASVVRYKNTSASASEISRDLKVDAFVEGGVVRTGDKIRVTRPTCRRPNGPAHLGGGLPRRPAGYTRSAKRHRDSDRT